LKDTLFTAGYMVEELSKIDPNTPILLFDRQYESCQSIENLFSLRLIAVGKDTNGQPTYIKTSKLGVNTIQAVVINDYDHHY